MSAPIRVGLYAVLLVIVFAVSFVTAGALAPEQAARPTVEHTQTQTHQGGDDAHRQ